MAKYYIGIIICENSCKIGIVDPRNGTRLVEEILENISNIPKNQWDDELAIIIHRSICGIDFERGHILHVAIAVQNIFSVDESDLEKLKHSLVQRMNGNLSLSNIHVVPFDATAYIGIFDGVIVKADGGVSIAHAESAKTFQIAERGHLIGDPGSAYWIANKCLRMIYDHDDGIEYTDFDLSAAKKQMNEYFDMKWPVDILKPLYSDFSKERINAFSERLAKLALQGDAFCVNLFQEAGRKLGGLLHAFLCRALKENQFISEQQTISTLGVGYVWNNYSLIRKGLIEAIDELNFTQSMNSNVKELRIYQMVINDSYAVAILAGKLSDPKFHLDGNSKANMCNLIATEYLKMK